MNQLHVFELARRFGSSIGGARAIIEMGVINQGEAEERKIRFIDGLDLMLEDDSISPEAKNDLMLFRKTAKDVDLMMPGSAQGIFDVYNKLLDKYKPKYEGGKDA